MSTALRQRTIQAEFSANKSAHRQAPGEHTAESTAAWRADVGGTSASVAEVVSAEDVGALRPGEGMLVVTRGPNNGAQFRLDTPVKCAGRHPASDIYLDDITVSRRHAEFRRENGEFRIVDSGSLNSTYLNGEPVDSQVLADGDQIQIGKFRLMFVTGPTSDRPPDET